jgi:F0F1-type ATP synthase assembly protein I
MTKNKHNTEKTSYSAILLVYQLGLTIVLSILFFMFVGINLDKFLATKPIFTILCIIFGVLGGCYTVYKEIMKIK